MMKEPGQRKAPPRALSGAHQPHDDGGVLGVRMMYSEMYTLDMALYSEIYIRPTNPQTVKPS
jgi:hypothetical protein